MFEDIKFRFQLQEKVSTNTPIWAEKSFDDIYGKPIRLDGSGKKLHENYTKGKKKVNDNQFVFANFKEGAHFSHKFSCYNSVKNVAFTGTIIYNEKDSIKVQKIFDDLCNSTVIQ